MNEDWLADVRRYVADADEEVVRKIVNYCGIALRNKDSSLVSFSDPAETARVREKFLKKKLALTGSDAELDATLAKVGERMKADRNKNRVTVYYLLAEHYDMLDLFGGTKRGSIGTASLAAGAATATGIAASAATPSAAAPPAKAEPMGLASAPTPPPTPTPTPAAAPVPIPTPSPTPSVTGGGGAAADDGIVETGCAALLVVIGAIALAALLAWWAMYEGDEEEAAPAPVVAAAPAETEEPAVPEGAGVILAERDERPMLTVYFDSGSSDIAQEFEASAADMLAYLEANPDATVAISGFNDPTGNAELNAELSKNRAEGVQTALVALGIAEDRTDLVRPDDTTTTDMTPEQARRVEVTIIE